MLAKRRPSGTAPVGGLPLPKGGRARSDGGLKNNRRHMTVRALPPRVRRFPHLWTTRGTTGVVLCCDRIEEETWCTYHNMTSGLAASEPC